MKTPLKSFDVTFKTSMGMIIKSTVRGESIAKAVEAATFSAKAARFSGEVIAVERVE